MASRSVIETLMGAVVLIVAAGFVYIAYESGNISSNAGGYQVLATFERVDGLSVGSDVRVGGIKVGTVQNQTLDTQTGLYQANVTLGIQGNVPLPKDTSAAIVSDGLLGNKYVALEPGGDDAMLAPGDKISQTQSSINIETLIGKFMFGGAESGDETVKKPEATFGPSDNTDFSGTAPSSDTSGTPAAPETPVVP
jgi:phospholipid/cholesterol/gamma-HCH transport system substrate-binding protein